MSPQEQVEYEVIPICPLCGERNSRLLFIGKDRRFKMPGEFPVVSCTGCGLVRLARRPKLSRLGIYYPPNDYPPYIIRQDVHSLKARVRDFIAKTILCDDYDKNLAQSNPGGRILDIGCGAGQCLTYYKEMGWEPFGVEISNAASRRAMESGHAVFRGVLEDARFPDDYFDLVRARHVLEHLPNPVESLLEMRRVLKNHGTLLLEVPNWSGLWARIFKQWYWQVDSPRHFFLFDRAVLLRAVETSGFRVKSTWTCSTLYGVDESLRLVASDIFSEIRWNRHVIRIAQMLIRLFSVLPDVAIDRAGMGENLIVLAEK